MVRPIRPHVRQSEPIMAEVFSFVQKIVLIAIFAWLGIQFTTPDADKEDAAAAPQNVIATLLG